MFELVAIGVPQLNLIGLAVSLALWMAAVAWVVRLRAALLERATEEWAEWAKSSGSSRFRSVAIGDSAEGLAWLAVFSLMFLAVEQGEPSLATELGSAVALAGVWTYAEHARNAALSSARGGGPPYRDRSRLRSLWVAHWSARLIMWIGFLATACFAGRALADLF